MLVLNCKFSGIYRCKYRLWTIKASANEFDVALSKNDNREIETANLINPKTVAKIRALMFLP